MNNEPMECPRCKEIALKHINTETDTSVGTFEEWRCDECGNYLTMDVPKYPGFRNWFNSMDKDVLDSMSMTERMQMAFNAGRTYECERTIEQLKSLRESTAGLGNVIKRYV